MDGVDLALARIADGSYSAGASESLGLDFKTDCGASTRDDIEGTRHSPGPNSRTSCSRREPMRRLTLSPQL